MVAFSRLSASFAHFLNWKIGENYKCASSDVHVQISSDTTTRWLVHAILSKF